MRERLNPGLVFTLSGLLALGGAACGESAETFVPENTEFVGVNFNQDELDALTEWLEKNPDRRIVSLATIYAQDAGIDGFQLVAEPGDNTRQRCEILDVGYHTGMFFESGADAFSAQKIQEWIDSHPDRDVVAIAAIPAGEAGVESYIICSTEIG